MKQTNFNKHSVMIKIKQNSFLEKKIFTLIRVIFYQFFYYHLNTGYQIKINIDRFLNIDRLKINIDRFWNIDRLNYVCLCTRVFSSCADFPFPKINIDRLISCILPLHLRHFQFLYVVLLILWQGNPAVSWVLYFEIFWG